jgi:hypothetical protein
MLSHLLDLSIQHKLASSAPSSFSSSTRHPSSIHRLTSELTELVRMVALSITSDAA